MICEPLPFNVIDRRPDLPEFENTPTGKGDPADTLWLTLILVGLLATVVGVIILSRWTWTHPAQAVVGLVLLACAAWGIARGMSG